MPSETWWTEGWASEEGWRVLQSTLCFHKKAQLFLLGPEGRLYFSQWQANVCKNQIVSLSPWGEACESFLSLQSIFWCCMLLSSSTNGDSGVRQEWSSSEFLITDRRIYYYIWYTSLKRNFKKTGNSLLKSSTTSRSGIATTKIYWSIYVSIYVSSWRMKCQPLQYSCLENPMDRGPYKVSVQRVTKRWIWPSD